MENIIPYGSRDTCLCSINCTLMSKQFLGIFDVPLLFHLTVERNQSICDKQCIVSHV